jgi:PAS domain S-box-containing protein
VPYFICPNCKQRSVDHDGRHGLLDAPPACETCGFGFLFELLEDYYPGPTTGFVVCDQAGRVLALGRGVFELTGYREQDVLGRELAEAFELSDPGPAATALEWGVRRFGEQLELRTRSGSMRAVTADFFPAYDGGGGLLVALAPR